jgi:hypothetical protein
MAKQRAKNPALRRLVLAGTAALAICAALPQASYAASKFINFTTPKALANGGTDPTDLELTVTTGATISKGTAVLPTIAWPAPGKTGNGSVIGAGNTIIFNSTGFLRAGDVVTGTISLQKGVNNLAITGAEWSYPVPLLNKAFNFAENGVKVSWLNIGGGGTGVEGEVVVTNLSGATEYFSNFLLSYNIPAANFVDTGDGLANLSTNNLYIGSGTPVPASLVSLAPDQSAFFVFGANTVEPLDYIAFSFDAYSSPSLSSADYLGSMGYASNAPEPSTWALLILGFAGLMGAGRRRSLVLAS